MNRILKCPAGHSFNRDETHRGPNVICAHPGCGLEFQLVPVQETATRSRATCLYCGSPLDHGALSCAECGRRRDTGELAERPETQSPTPHEVLAELRNRKSESSSPMKAAAILVISMVAFYALGLTIFSHTIVLLLVLVVFIHEMGHIAAMRLFGYRDLRILFIPLFGALAMGQPARSERWQRAVVSLAGPLPGMVIGLALLYVGIQVDSHGLFNAGVVFLILNALNLLPIYPLDGGHFVNDVLFCRSRWIEFAFRALTAFGLLLISLLLRSVVLGIFGLLMLIGAWFHLRMGSIAAEAREVLPIDRDRLSHDVPQEAVEPILRIAQRRLGATMSARTAAAMVRGVWESLTVPPPGLIASAMLMLVYCVSLLSVVAVPLAYVLLVSGGVLETPSGGPGAELMHGFHEGMRGDD